MTVHNSADALAAEMMTIGAAARTAARAMREASGEAKTKAFLASMGALGITSGLFIDGAAVDVGFARASANVPHIDVLPAIGANVYDILKHDTLVLTRAAVSALEARVNG